MLVLALHIELDESAGQRLRFPGSDRLARAQPHHHIAEAQGLPRLHRQIAFNAVALVEQADHRDPLGHRRLAAAILHGR